MTYARRRPVIEEIEPRILFSADFAPAVLDHAPPAPAVEHRVIDQTGEFVGDAAPEQQVRRHEVVFIDPATPDAAELIRDIEAQSGAERQLQIVLLDPYADGIEQISSALAGLKDVDAVHIIGHGADGEMRLGSGTLDLDAVTAHAAQIEGWSRSLAPGADLLLYGCNVAQSADGRALVNALAKLAGTDVAASENPTGAASLGGDWILEYHTGHVETVLAVSATERAAWAGLLDTGVGTPPADANASTQATIASTPLAFEQNVGQASAEVDFLARGSGYAVALAGGDAILGVQNGNASQVVRLNVVGANPDRAARAEDLLESRSNYLIGGQSDWHTDIANYGGVRYDNVYDGVDLRYYGNQRQLEYDFVVHAGASADPIKLKFDGAQNATVADNGDLVLTLDSDGHSIAFKAPVAYQDGPDGHEAVASRYRLEVDGSVGFDVGAYDTSRTLVIDPVLSYGTYFGGSGNDVANGIAVDSTGNVYLTGYTPGITGLGALLGLGGGDQVFVTKLSPNLSSAIYTTYIGGSGDDYGASIAVDPNGNAYVTGGTQSSDFPTASAYQNTLTSSGLLATSQDAFVFKLNAAGNALVYSTYLGGSGTTDSGWAIAVDTSGSAYVAGVASSSDFPTTAGAVDTAYAGGEAFAAKLNAAGSTLIYSTFIGGNGAETGYGIAVDAGGDAIVVGNTSSTDLATTPIAFQSSYGGNTDAFVARINSTGAALTYLTYLGGSSTDTAYNVALDGTGNIYLTGQTSSSNFALSSNALDTTLGGATDAFVTVLNPNASGAGGLVYSTYLGGKKNDEAGLGLGVDASGRIYVTGQTDSNDFAVTAGALKNGNSSKVDAFVVTIDPYASASNGLVYGSYFGGNKDDYATTGVYSNGKFYIAGDTASGSGIATSGSADSTQAGGTDAFAAIFSIAPTVTTTPGTLAYTEDAGPVALDVGLVVSNPGAGTIAIAQMQITGNYANGEDVLAFDNANAWGIVGTWNAATGTLALTGTASVANYQAALRTVTYQNTSQKPSASTRIVTTSVSDGVVDSPPATRLIAVTPINDRPSIVAQPGSTAEDTPLLFSVANGNPISIADIDADAAPLQVTLSVTSGTLTLSQTSGLTFVTGNGGANATMTFTGSQTSINAALDGLRFDPNANYNGGAVLTVVTNDQGNTGTGGALSAALSVAITVTPVNDAPVISIPGPQAAQQTTALVLSSANGNAIIIADVDAGLSDLQVTLTPGNGTLSLGSTAGLTSVLNSPTTTTLVGTLASLNNALDGLVFTPSSGYTGPASLQIATDDLGNSGAGGALATTSTVTITVSTEVAPTLTVAGTVVVYTENDPATVIDGSIIVNDPDSPMLDHAVVRVGANYVAGQDVLAFTNQAGIAGSWDAGTGTLTLNGSASAASYQTALRSITYRNLSDDPRTTARSIAFVMNDGVADSAIVTSTIAIAAVNDAPVNTVPGTQTINEDTPVIFSVANGNEIRIADVDAGTSPVKVTLTAVNGSLTLAQVAGLTVGGGGNGSANLILVGTVDNINAALNGLRFDPAVDFNGTASLQIATEDQGSTGAGGTQSATGTVSIVVAAVNDAPSGSDQTATTLEDTAYVFSASDFGFSDAHDAPSPNALLSVCITTVPNAGQLTANGVAVISGQFIALSNLIAGKLVYMPGSNDSGGAYASFTFQVGDNGGTANGGADLDPTPKTMTIDVTAVNDAPEGTDTTVTTAEDTGYVFSLADFGFTDPDDSPVNQLLAMNVETLPAAGSLSDNGVAVTAGQSISASDIVGGKLRFAPVANANGTLYSSFTFRVQDDGGSANGGVDLATTTYTTTIDVTPVDDAPVVAVNTGARISQSAALAIDGRSLAAIDVDNVAAQLVYTVSALPTAGTLMLNGVQVPGNGTFTQADVAGGLLVYQNGGGSAASDSFTFIISDNAGRTVGPAIFNITVDISAPVAPTPVVTPPLVAPPSPPAVIPPSPTTTHDTSPAPSAPSPTVPGDPGDPDATGLTSSGSVPSGEVAAAPTEVGGEVPQPLNDAGSLAQGKSTNGRFVVVAPAKLAAVTNGMSGATLSAGGALVRGDTFSEGQIESLGIQSTQIAGFSDSSVPLLEAYRSTLGNKSWVGELDRLRDAAENQIKVEHKVVASTAAITGAMSVGYVVWLLRGGLLLSSLLSSLPAWHVIDPVPVLARGNRREDNDGSDDPIERLFGRARAVVGMHRGGKQASETARVPSKPAATLSAAENTDGVAIVGPTI